MDAHRSNVASTLDGEGAGEMSKKVRVVIQCKTAKCHAQEGYVHALSSKSMHDCCTCADNRALHLGGWRRW